MSGKIEFLEIDGWSFNLQDVNSCITGNWINRTFYRLKLKKETGVFINDKKVINSLNKLSFSCLTNICNATAEKTNKKSGEKMKGYSGIFNHSKNLIETKFAGKIKKLTGASTFSDRIALSISAAKNPILAKSDDQSYWVIKNEEGKWQVLTSEGDLRILDNDAVKLVDFDAAQVEIYEGDFVINVDQQILKLPETFSKDIPRFKEAIEKMKKEKPQAQDVRFTFGASDKKFLVKSTEPAVTESFITDSSKFFRKTLHNDKMICSVVLQAKGYLPKGEYGADWATVNQLRNCTLAIVADAAKNTEDSHKGSVDLTRRFRKHLLSNLIQLGSHDLSLAQVQIALTQAIIKTQFEMRADPKSTRCTMACTLVLPAEDGNLYAVGFCIGDSRVMLKKADGSAADLSPTDYSSRYFDAGSTFGSDIDKIRTIFCKLDSGDTLLLGSDGFGDNMEAKTLGKSPFEALQELYNFASNSMSNDLRELAENPLDWIKQAASPEYWTKDQEGPETDVANRWRRDLNDDQKKLLQELHDLYAVTVLAKMEKTDIVSTVHDHCTQSCLVKAGLLGVKVQKEIQMRKQDSEAISSGKLTKEEFNLEVDKITGEIVNQYLSDYKDLALQITGKPADSEEMRNMFQLWNINPKQAHEWLSPRMGKPDDFSLIALQVK